QARDLQCSEYLTNIDPFVIVKCGADDVKTNPIQGAGANPTFDTQLSLTVADGENEVIVEIWEANKIMAHTFIGRAKHSLAELRRGKAQDLWLPIHNDAGEKTGEVKVIFNPLP
ncbi:C2 domain-containing protein, partial [Catenaria anguillulae PL171]